MEGSIANKLETFNEILRMLDEMQAKIRNAHYEVEGLYKELRTRNMWNDYHADNFKYSFLNPYIEKLEAGWDTLQNAKVHVVSKKITLEEHLKA